MSGIDTSSGEPLDAAAFIALGLLGAGLAVGTGALLRSPDTRATCVQLMQKLGLPQVLREIAAGVLVRLGESLSRHDSIGGAL